MSRRIAIVEDEPVIRANYADVLKKQGYEVAAYAGRSEALGAFRSRLPVLVLIDIGLADDIDGGFALCRELRAFSANLPIIFLSARDSDFDIVSGLRLGADDYLTKDVSLPHLLARISALFRRVDAAAQSAIAEDVMHRGRLALDAQLMRDAEMVVDDGTITSHVKRIRKKFLAVDAAFDAIETVYGMGYRWTEP